jgi:hypothetical protein
LVRTLYPLKGQNWLSLTGRELIEKLPDAFLKTLDESQLQGLSLLRKKADHIGSELRNQNPKAYEDFLKAKFPIVGPYTIRESMSYLSGIPSAPKGNVKFQELYDLANCLIEIWHIFPSLDSSVLEFYKSLDKDFTWSRYDGISPRKAFSDQVIEKNLSIKRDKKLIESLLKTWTGPNETRSFVKSNLFKEEAEDVKPADRITSQFVLAIAFKPDNPTSPNPLLVSVQVPEENRKRAEEFLSDVQPKMENYGPSTTVLTKEGKMFLGALAQSPEVASLVPNVKNYLLSFADPAFANLAIMRMHASLQEKSVYLERTESFGDIEALMDEPPDELNPYGGYD